MSDLSESPAVTQRPVQMAMGFFTHLAGNQAEAWFGGSKPATTINPAAVEALAERGRDIFREELSLPGS